jgi:hypothetical protein
VIPEAVRAVDRFADSLRLSGGPLSSADLIQSARRSVGLTDFGTTSLQDPLEVLLESYEREASLSVFGRLAARWDAVRFLSNLLLLREAEKRVPAILDQSIDRPIFITGLPRTGTTFLHNLLAQDQSNRVVRVWETIYPSPGQRSRAPRPDRRPRQVDRQLAMFRKLAPELESLYPMTAHSPQECTEITAHVFRSLRFDTTHAVPTYRRWLDDVGHNAAYQFHKRFLKHLQYWNGRGHWVLKCPDHVFALDAIHDVYPDARFIFVHRNPLEVLPSVARLTDVLRRPFTRRIDRFEIGRQVGERWNNGAATLVRVAQEVRLAPDRALHLKFRDFVRGPFDSIAAIYSHFGLTLSPDASERIRRFAAERPDGGYGRHRTRLDEYGLDGQAKRRGYQDYAAYFGV